MDASARDGTDAKCMGRSRGGLTTKIHAVVDADGLPIRLALTEGQAHDGRSAECLIDEIEEGQNSSATDRLRRMDELRRPVRNAQSRRLQGKAAEMACGLLRKAF